jgi:hypothetical protein
MQGFGRFFMYRPLLPMGWRIVQIICQRQRKSTNTVPPLLVQYEHQANPRLSMNNYTPVINRNDKNKQLTLLSQRKLALTAINKHFAL